MKQIWLTAILCSILFIVVLQPFHIPFLGSPQQINTDKAITSFLILDDQTRISFLTPNELSHMQDVKHLIDIAFGLLLISLLFFSVDKKTLLVASILPAIFLVLIFFDFTTIFEIFHQILFPQGNYTFSYSSILITKLLDNNSK